MQKMHWTLWTDACWMDVNYVSKWLATDARLRLIAGPDGLVAAALVPVRAPAAVPRAAHVPAAARVRGLAHVLPARAPVARPRADPAPVPGLRTTVARVPSRLR